MIKALLARFLPSLVPGLGAFLNPWVLLAAIGLFAAGFGSGVRVEAWRWDASLASIAEAQEKALQAFYARQRAIMAEIGAELAGERAARDRDRRTFERRLADANEKDLTTVACDESAGGAASVPASAADEAAARGSAPAVRFTPEFVGLWDAALVQGLPAAVGAERVDGGAAGTAPPGPKDLLDNLGENGRRTNECTSKLLAWQRLARKNGWVK